MRLLILCALCLLPLSAFAQPVPPLPSDTGGAVTVLPVAPGVTSYWDQRGGHTTVYGSDPAMQWYSTQDPQGHITQQGYLFNPWVERPLRVPGDTETNALLETLDRQSGRR